MEAGRPEQMEADEPEAEATEPVEQMRRSVQAHSHCPRGRLGVTGPTAKAKSEHHGYPLLCLAYPGGRHRGREITEAQAPVGEAEGSNTAEILALPAASTFAPPTNMGVDFFTPLPNPPRNNSSTKLSCWTRRGGTEGTRRTMTHLLARKDGILSRVRRVFICWRRN